MSATTFHVDLEAVDTDAMSVAGLRDGSRSYPMTWTQVVNWLRTAPASGGYDVVFALTGQNLNALSTLTPDTDAGSSDAAVVLDGCNDARILFIRDENPIDAISKTQAPVPVLGGTCAGLSAFIDITNANNVAVEFRGILIHTNASTGFVMTRAKDSRKTIVRAHNNIASVIGASFGFVSANNCKQKSGFVVGFNTVHYRAPAQVPQAEAAVPLLFVGAASNSEDPCSVGFFGNFVANHVDTSYIVVGALVGADNDFYHGYNVFGGSQSYLIPYTAAGAKITALGSSRSCNYATQGVCGVSWFHDSAQVGYSKNDVSGYWPIQGGSLIGSASGFAAASTDSNSVSVSARALFSGLGLSDIYGRLRSGYDSGAVEKSCVTESVTYHVDLAVPGAAQLLGPESGSESNPLSVADAMRLHSRLAPCNNSVVFVMRNTNYHAGRPKLGSITMDLGPRVNDAEFTGTGSIRFQGYKLFVKNPPMLVVRRIESQTSLVTEFFGLKILWNEGSDLFYADPTRTSVGGRVRILNSIVRSIEDTCDSGIVTAGENAPLFDIVGSIFDARHLSGTSSGLIVFGNSAPNMVFGNTFILPGTVTVVGTSDTMNGTGTYFDANYVNCSRGQGGVSAPTWSFTGWLGTHNKASSHSLSDVFVSPEPSGGFLDSTWEFTGNVTEPLDIVQSAAIPASVSVFAKDIRGCVRDASTGTGAGSSACDAGPYEYSYAIPSTKNFYVDLGRAGSGHLGLRNDRWSYADLVAYFAGLEGTVLDAPILIKCLGSCYAESQLVLKRVDAMPFASIVIAAESPYSLPTFHVAASEDWFILDGGAGLRVRLEAVVMDSNTPNMLVCCMDSSGATTAEKISSKSSLEIVNSVGYRREAVTLSVKHASALRTASLELFGVITIAGVSKRFGTDIVIGAGFGNGDCARAIATAFNTDTGFAGLDHRAVIVSESDIAFEGPTTITLSGSLGDSLIATTNSTDSEPLVFADSSRDLIVIGSGFVAAHAPGCKRSVAAIEASRGVIAYSSFTGDSDAETGPNSVAVFGKPSLSTQYNISHGFNAGCVFNTTDTHSQASAQIVSVDALNRSVYIDNFKPANSAIGFAPVTSLSDAVIGYGIDFDAIRGLRGSDGTYDAGPVEIMGKSITGSLTEASESAISGLTQDGSAWNSRRMTDGFGFKLVGFAVAGTGFVSYAVNKALRYHQRSMPASIRLTLQQNQFNSGDSIGFVFGSASDAASCTFTLNHAGGWVAGSNVIETLKNIAKSFRNSKTFNTYCYCYIESSSIVIVSRRLHASANSYTMTSSVGTLSGSSRLFSGGVTAEEPESKVWPVNAPYAVFDRMESPDQTSRSFVVRLGFDECNFPIGQFAVIAECTASPIPGEVGTRCVYAYANVPLHVKHDREVVVKRIVFQF